MDKKKQGKKNKAAGARFELRVRKDLESKGWIVSKWMNNVEFNYPDILGGKLPMGILIPAKHKFRGPGIPMAIGTGFPDFIAFKDRSKALRESFECWEKNPTSKELLFEVIGVEVKSNGFLDKTEKEKCRWLLGNHIFSKILIASKGKKRGEIKYQEA